MITCNSIETLCIHGSAHKTKDANYSLSYPIYQTASFSHLDLGHNRTGFDYTRESNPTRQYLEETISSLEGAFDSVAFASGMAAVAAVFELFKPQDHIICGLDLYGGVVRYADEIAVKNNIEVEYVDTRSIDQIKGSIRDNTKAIYFETPSNPMMHITDIRQVADIAHEAGLLLIVDNTFLTPYYQNPISLGADIVVHSATKYLCGHNDTVCGVVCSANEKEALAIRRIAKTVGSALDPFECWLLLRGLKTLPVRMERHQENAVAIAKWLENQPFVKEVIYTGLESHPQHELHKSQASGFGGMISFTVTDKDTAIGILKNVNLITFAESLGGTESLITYPAVQTHPDVPPLQREKLGITDCLLRLSVGLENVNDLINDLSLAAKNI